MLMQGVPPPQCTVRLTNSFDGLQGIYQSFSLLNHLCGESIWRSGPNWHVDSPHKWPKLWHVLSRYFLTMTLNPHSDSLPSIYIIISQAMQEKCAIMTLWVGALFPAERLNLGGDRSSVTSPWWFPGQQSKTLVIHHSSITLQLCWVASYPNIGPRVGPCDTPLIMYCHHTCWLSNQRGTLMHSPHWIHWYIRLILEACNIIKKCSAALCFITHRLK